MRYTNFKIFNIKKFLKPITSCKLIKAISIQLGACTIVLTMLVAVSSINFLYTKNNTHAGIYIMDKKISVDKSQASTEIFKWIPKHLQDFINISLKNIDTIGLNANLAMGGSNTTIPIKLHIKPLELEQQPAIPVFGTISSEFGYRKHPITNEDDYHTGLDIAAPLGTEIYATLDGIVISADESSSYGKNIIIEHKNGIVSLYAHCDEIFVKPKQKVSKNEKIALVGSTGISTGNHLHFEVRLDDSYIDPASFLNLYNIQ